MTRIHIVPVGLVDELWPAAAPLLAAALERHPFLGIEDLRELLLRELGDLVVAIDEGSVLGAAVMERIVYPKRITGNVLALGGRQGFYERALGLMTDRLEQWCIEHGCDSISMLGRPGWSKFVARRGWEILPSVAAWKELKAMPSEQPQAAGSAP